MDLYQVYSNGGPGVQNGLVAGVLGSKYSEISLLRPLEIKTTSLFRPIFASPRWYFFMILYSILRPPR